MEAFGKNVVGFLVKPLDAKSFQKVMEKALSDLCGQILEIEENGTTFLIPVRQIKYIEAQDKYTLAVTEEGEYFEKKGEDVRLDQGKTVKISRLKKNEIMEKYREFLRRKVRVM